MIKLSSYITSSPLLTQALTHRSYCNEHPNSTSNERLEFLGDSVLSLIISTRLFHLLPTTPEGELTARRSYLVQTSSLAAQSLNLGLDQSLLMSHGEEESGGRSNPTLLANTFEAVLAAIYLDSGFATCQKLIVDIFPDSLLISDLPIKDPKSLLQERSQAANRGTPVYKTLHSTGPDHAKEFTVSVLLGDEHIASASGSSKQRAEVAAATAALAKLFPEVVK